MKLRSELNYVILIKLNINFYEIIGCIYKGKLFVFCIDDINFEGNLFLFRENMYELSILVFLYC